MERTFYPFPSIEQFRSVCRRAPKEKIKFKGTVKLHGTNAAVVIANNEIYAQSRGRVLTREDDNYGFAKFVAENEGLFAQFLNNKSFEPIVFYGEWCGPGIQSSVAVAELPTRSFVVFAMSLCSTFVTSALYAEYVNELKEAATNAGAPIYDINDFQKWEMAIDFNQPELAIADLINITNEVEACCPVGKYFGIEGVGEGVVWSDDTYGLLFKVKGEKHSVTKVKKLAAVNVEKVNSIKEFIEKTVTPARLEQARSEVTPDLDIKKIGDFIRWVYSDIIKEESDTLAESGLEEKEVGKYVANPAKQWFFEQQA
jgi:RNA ligase